MKMKEIHSKLSNIEDQNKEAEENLWNLVQWNSWCKEGHSLTYLVQYQIKVWSDIHRKGNDTKELNISICKEIERKLVMTMTDKIMEEKK